MSVKRSWLQAVCIAALLSSFVVPCTAQEAEDPAYRQAIDDATESYSNGLFDEALASFRVAHRINPSARTWRGLGMTNFEQRRYTKAFAALRNALDDKRKPLTDEQRTETQALLTRASNYIAAFTLQFEPPTAALEVDGLPVELEGGVLFLDLGEHQLVLRAKDYAMRTLKLVVEGGERITLPIVLDPLTPPPTAVTTVVLPPTPTRAQILDVMNSGAPAVLACTSGIPGTATAKVVVSGRSGHVTKLDIEFDATFKKHLIPGPQLTLARLQYHYATCVFNGLKDLQFPKFSTPSFNVTHLYPLPSQRLQGKTAQR